MPQPASPVPPHFTINTITAHLPTPHRERRDHHVECQAPDADGAVVGAADGVQTVGRELHAGDGARVSLQGSVQVTRRHQPHLQVRVARAWPTEHDEGRPGVRSSSAVISLIVENCLIVLVFLFFCTGKIAVRILRQTKLKY